MKKNEIANKVVNGLFWRFLERIGAQGVSFIVSIVLARILMPEDYGSIALITVFTTILQVFVDSGLGNALIQKKDADDLDFSTVFYVNLFLCIVIYLIVFFLAPYIAEFYNDDSLIPIIRVINLILIISGVKNIQQAYVSRNMLFKRFFYSTLLGTIGSAFVGIIMAYKGFGVWALVAQQLSNATIDTIVLWFTVNWKPKLIFSFERLKVLFSYGWKLLVSNLINTFYNNMRQLFIGKMYSTTDLSFYNKGRGWPELLVSNINSSIDSVIFPAMSSQQDNKESVRNMTRRAIKTSSYIICPIMVGLMVVATPLVRSILTEKWLPSVPYIQVFCIIFALEPIQTANLNAIKAMGRSDLFLKLEIIKKSFGMIVLILSLKFGVFAIAVSLVISTVFANIANSTPNKKLLNYGYFDQIKDIVPSILLSALMGSIVWCVQLINLNDILTLVLQIITGIIVYVVGSFIFKLEPFEYLLNFIKIRIGKENKMQNV